MAAGERTIKIKITGDAKGLGKATREAEREVTKFGAKIENGIQKVTDKLPDILSGAISGLPPQGQAIALAITAGLAVALSSIIAAAISSAVLLAVGGGVLALGIKSAIDNPKVAKAFDGLKKKASKIFDDFGKPFEGPLIRAAKTLGKVLDEIRPQVQQIGKAIAPVIDTLAPALGKFLKNILPGIQKAVEASVPLWNTLAEKLPLIGTAISKFFDLISKNGDDTNQFVSDLIDFIAGLIISLGYVISKLTSMYSAFRNFFSNTGKAMLQFASYLINLFGNILDAAVRAFGWIPGIGGKLKTAQKEFSDFRGKVNAELNKIQDKNVYVKVFSNIWSVIGDITKALQGIGAVSVGGKNIGHRAMGGSVSAGRSYVVGEKGPELVTFGRNGYVTPNNQLAGSGGDNYYAVIDLANGVQQVVKLEFQKNNRQMARQLKAA